MGSAGRAKRREILWRKQKGRCFWCRRVTVLLPPDKHRKVFPDHMATLDHLDDRLSGRRGTAPRGQPRTVMACLQCNFARGKAAEARARAASSPASEQTA